jgi:transcriptional/translational regulatory protein YebC/TACO1
MSGHNKWSQIKNKKEVTDKKRGALFSKLLAAISVAARLDPNPQFNPRLTAAVEAARTAHVPQENIERAISKSSETKNLEELVIEAFGPEKSALVAVCITNNRNRTTSEMRHLLEEHGAKMGLPGSAAWAFEVPQPGGAWTPKFPQELSPEGKQKLGEIIEALEEREDIQNVFTNVINGN